MVLPISRKTLCIPLLERYLLNLAGNGASLRTKYLFFCGSAVVSPKKNGGHDVEKWGEWEEWYYHRLQAGVHFVSHRSKSARRMVANRSY